MKKMNAVTRIAWGLGRAIRFRPKIFAWVAVAVFVLNLFLPLLVLSLARKPIDLFAFNPWLSRLPEWLASSEAPWTGKLAFLSQMAIAWFIAENPIDGVEWGFIIDVPSLGRFLLASLLFGTYFALWAYRRDHLRDDARASSAAGQGGAVGALTTVLGFSTSPCSVMGCGVPVLPVIGLAFTGLSSSALAFLAAFSDVAFWVVLGAVTGGVVWFGWLVGAAAADPALSPRTSRAAREPRPESGASITSG
jgi:hypothetical protein